MWELVKYYVIYPADFVSFIKMKALSKQHKVNFSMVEQIAGTINAFVVTISIKVDK